MTALAAPERSGAACPVAPTAARAGQRVRSLLNEAERSALALRLAAGDTSAAGDVDDWPALFALARRERLAALAWLRAGGEIRARADAGTVARWRGLWADAARRGEDLLSACAEASRALSSAGVRLVVLKGAPLAESLYGDPCVRCSDDVDCYVAVADRARAARALEAAGWRAVLGRAPGDETFERDWPAGPVRLEMHSSLAPERLGHLPVGTPASVERGVAGRDLWVHAGALVPAYLAAHLATHFAPPLLWWLDLRQYWHALAESERLEALHAARRAGLGRYLAWALRGAAAVDGALAGHPGALAGLGVRPDGRRDVHQLWRHLALAPSAGAGLAALRGWVRPSWAAARDGGPVLGTARRALRLWRTLLPSSPAKADSPAAGSSAGTRPAPAALSATGLLDAARSVTAAGGELALTLSGESMAPTLRPGDTLLLGAPPPRPRRGDIVLVALGPARPALHRVERVFAAEEGGAVQTRGDNCVVADPPAAWASVVARVVASQRAGVWTAHVATLRFGSAAAARGVALRFRARAAQLRRRLRRHDGLPGPGTGGAGR